jgi:hypothetical protein
MLLNVFSFQQPLIIVSFVSFFDRFCHIKMLMFFDDTPRKTFSHKFELNGDFTRQDGEKVRSGGRLNEHARYVTTLTK